MKGEETTIQIGYWIMGQVQHNPNITKDMDSRVLRNINAIDASEHQTSETLEKWSQMCAQALKFENNAEFQALFKIVYQLWMTGRLELMMEFWENRNMVDALHE